MRSYKRLSRSERYLVLCTKINLRLLINQKVIKND